MSDSKAPLRVPVKFRELDPLFRILQRDILAATQATADAAQAAAAQAQTTAEAAQTGADSALAAAQATGVVANQTAFLTWEVF